MMTMGWQVSLLYGNQDVDTILCKAELDDYAAAHPGRFHCHHTVAKAPPPEARETNNTGWPSSSDRRRRRWLLLR
jgi:ferredoxin-NADP reductase